MAASTIPFKLITPTKVVFEGDAELVIAVTTEGEEGILPHHAPFLAALKPGILRANVLADGKNERLELATGEGFMQALPDRLTILVDEALHFDDIDVAKTRDDLANATDPAAIEFANAKLRLVGSH
ncbi:MAG: ATP synthase F1 subunit epsilon [Candidatus Eremiobacteraeota bacterium]|nr:ATP synthase F1 subunit epsilon [Candidatus Eremiobacteraeota bacterium]